MLGDEEHNRKEWIENRLEELADCFAVAVAGFSAMDNHLHVLIRLDSGGGQTNQKSTMTTTDCAKSA